jgi:riboflavin synthase
MFTGIVEELGEVVRLDWFGEGAVLAVRGPTVTADVFVADVMKETFDRSALGKVAIGDRVNLERAVTPSTRLGGHIVQGHVDGVGRVLSRERGDRWDDVRIALPPEINRYVVEKGSVCVDGISLTVVAVDDESFSVSLIPTTLDMTTLGRKDVGSLVNLEVDVIAKYVEKLVGARP